MMAEKKQLKNILSQGSHAAEATHQFSEQPAGLDKQIDKLENRRSKKEPLRAEGNLFGQRIRVLTEKLLCWPRCHNGSYSGNGLGMLFGVLSYLPIGRTHAQ